MHQDTARHSNRKGTRQVGVACPAPNCSTAVAPLLHGRRPGGPALSLELQGAGCEALLCPTLRLVTAGQTRSPQAPAELLRGPPTLPARLVCGGWDAWPCPSVPVPVLFEGRGRNGSRASVMLPTSLPATVASLS